MMLVVQVLRYHRENSVKCITSLQTERGFDVDFFWNVLDDARDARAIKHTARPNPPPLHGGRAARRGGGAVSVMSILKS